MDERYRLRSLAYKPEFIEASKQAWDELTANGGGGGLMAMDINRDNYFTMFNDWEGDKFATPYGLSATPEQIAAAQNAPAPGSEIIRGDRQAIDAGMLPDIFRNGVPGVVAPEDVTQHIDWGSGFEYGIDESGPYRQAVGSTPGVIGGSWNQVGSQPPELPPVDTAPVDNPPVSQPPGGPGVPGPQPPGGPGVPGPQPPGGPSGTPADPYSWDGSDFERGAPSLDGGGGIDPADYAFDRYVPGQESPWGIPEVQGGNRDFYRNQFINLLRQEQGLQAGQQRAAATRRIQDRVRQGLDTPNVSPEVRARYEQSLQPAPMDWSWLEGGLPEVQVNDRGYADPRPGFQRPAPAPPAAVLPPGYGDILRGGLV